MTTPNDLSDKALAVFAFAIYHQLSSGDVVSAVAADDGSGHRVDPEAVAELESRELAERNGDKVVFTAAGALMLTQLVDRLRGRW
jgi:hypothetical protein